MTIRFRTTPRIYSFAVICIGSLCCACEERPSRSVPELDAASVDANADTSIAEADAGGLGGLPKFDAAAPRVEAGQGGQTAGLCALDADRDGFRHVSADGDDALDPSCAKTEPGDCDDTTPKIDPESPERCNAQDDDCDGQIDEGRSCSIAFEPLLDTQTNTRLTLVSDSSGVLYRYRSDTGVLERLGADDAPIWSVPATGFDSQVLLAVDAARGAVYLAAIGVDDATNEKRTIVSRYEAATGQLTWKRVLEIGSRPTAIAIDGAGDVHVSGGQWNSAGAEESRAGMLAQLRAADGEPVKLETPLDIEVLGVAAAPDGALAVVAQFADINVPPTMLGPCRVTPVRGNWDPFVMYVAADGSCGWVQNGLQEGGSTGANDFTQVAFLSDGAIAIAGAAFPELRLADADLTDPRSKTELGLGVHKSGGDEAVLVMLERSGSVRWFRRVPNLGDDAIHALRVDSAELILGLKLDYYEVYSDRSYASSAAHGLGVLMSFDAASGTELWNRDLEHASTHDTDDITSIARAADGSLRVVVSGDVLRVRPPAGN